MTVMCQKVAFLSTGRSEYYQLLPVLQAAKESDLVHTQLLLGGSHAMDDFGATGNDIADDIAEEVLHMPSTDLTAFGAGAHLSAARLASDTLWNVSQALTNLDSDLLVIMGDRFEHLAAAVGATCIKCPIAHVHGGETTLGAIDENCRHAITKLSSLHFTSTDVYRARIVQMGEQPDHVFAVGAPLVDQIQAQTLMDINSLEERLGLSWVPPVALVAYHPETQQDQDEGEAVATILETLSDVAKTIVITGPNHDPGHANLISTAKAFSEKTDNCGYYTNLGSHAFLSVMAKADLMVGNSSSGIHEASSFQTPVVNIGNRQQGRLRPTNVIDVSLLSSELCKAYQTALSESFLQRISPVKNPFGDGAAGQRIIAHLEAFAPYKECLDQKPFCDGETVKKLITQWAGNHD